MLIEYVGKPGIKRRGELLVLFMFYYILFCRFCAPPVLYVMSLIHSFVEIRSFNVDRSYHASGNHPVLNIDSKGHGVHAFLNNMLIGLLFTLLYAVSLIRRLLRRFYSSNQPLWIFSVSTFSG
jgi:hypothetical protein